MSKSKGNVVVPSDILERYGADAVRWRAAMARPGMDSPFDETQMKVGRRLAMKVLNASRFVLGMPGAGAGLSAVTNPLDRGMLETLKGVVFQATEAFERFEYTAALEVVRVVLLGLLRRLPRDGQGACLRRAGAAESASAVVALRTALGVMLRLFAPFLPFVTEEVWSWWQEGSVHTASWPTEDEIGTRGDAQLLTDLAQVLVALRGAKSTAKVSMKTEVLRTEVRGRGDALDRLRDIESDLRAVGRITGEIEWIEAPLPLDVAVDLATADA